MPLLCPLLQANSADELKFLCAMPHIDERHYRSSVHREKLVEHLFIGGLLRWCWVSDAACIDVLKPEVDRTGYDVVLQSGHIVRHVQLKTSLESSHSRSVTINAALALQPSGCVVWIVVDDRLEFKEFLWFGAEPGVPLPSLSRFKQARSTRANAQGVKSQRANTKVVPKSEFQSLRDMHELHDRLFSELGTT